MKFDDARNLEVFQLCVDIIGKGTAQITSRLDRLQNLMPVDERERLPREIAKQIDELKPCFRKAAELRKSMGDKIPYELQKQYGVQANRYDEAVRMFRASQRG